MTRPVRFRGRDDKGALVRGSVVTVVSAVAMFVMLSGIAECASNCPVYDENGDQVFGPDGNPVSVACINCIESNPPPCKSDAWSLAEGVACDAANQPSVPDGTACDFSEDGDGTCTAGVCDGPRLPCTEQGILDAIAAGGGPRYFDCSGPTTINTTAEVVIDNDVVLDGEGNITLDAGGAHRVVAVPAGVTAELRGMTVTGGGTLDGGFGQGILNDGDLILTSCVVTENGTEDDIIGGIFSTIPGGSLTLVDSEVSFNRGTGYAGLPAGILAEGDLTVTRSTVANNGPTGEDIYQGLLQSGVQGTRVLEVSDSVIGALTYVGVDSATVERSFFGGRLSALSDGGAPGTLFISDSLFVSAGIAIDTSIPTTLVNSTLIPAFVTAIALRVGTGTGSTLRSVTISGRVEGAATVSGSIVVGACGAASLISEGYNVEVGGDTCGFTDPSDQVNVTPAQLNLGPLQDNGGPTQTYLPETGSIAIDAIPAAECTLTTDQRGISRPQGAACDIGAVEVEQP